MYRVLNNEQSAPRKEVHFVFSQFPIWKIPTLFSKDYPMKETLCFHLIILSYAFPQGMHTAPYIGQSVRRRQQTRKAHRLSEH